MRLFHTARARLLTAALLLVPLAASAAGLQVIIDGKAIVFRDVPANAWFATYVQQAAEAGIVNGYKDTRGNLTGRFGPSNSITLAETLKIAVEGAGYDDQLYGAVVDSGMKRHWASSYIAVAKSEQFAFLTLQARWDRPATRSEVASIFVSAFQVNLENATAVDSRYSDVKSSTMFAQSIEALSHDAVVAGDTDAEGQTVGTFRPGEPINRAEVAKIVMNARAKYGTPGAGKRPDESSAALVSYTNAGFSPSVLRVNVGTTITFRNDSGEDLWVASNPHPTHTGLAGFDAVGSIAQGQAYAYTFARIGTWGYHNHLHPSFGGTVIVE